MNIIKKIKQLIKDIRRFLIIGYARNCYKRMVDRAEKLNKEDGDNYYVCIDPTNPNRIIVFNRREFRLFRRRFNALQIRLSEYLLKETRKIVEVREDGSKVVKITREKMVAKINKSTMVDIYNGCFYSTRLKRDSTPENVEMRRLAYIQWVLDLNDKPKDKKRKKKNRK